jgi:hypothetical protein
MKEGDDLLKVILDLNVTLAKSEAAGKKISMRKCLLSICFHTKAVAWPKGVLLKNSSMGTVVRENWSISGIGQATGTEADNGEDVRLAA